MASNSMGKPMKSIEFTRNSIEAFIRVGLLFLLAYYCLTIVRPFIVPILWGIIIAVAVYPLFLRMKASMGNRWASVVYTLIALALLITPTVMVTDSLIETSTIIGKKYESGELTIPPPNDGVREWPLIGDKVHAAWSEASDNIAQALKDYEAQVKRAAEVAVGAVANAFATVLLSVLSVIISGLLVANADACYRFTCRLFSRLTGGEQGAMYTSLSTATIRSVAQGVLGIALIQSLLGALGMMVMDIPAWGVWTLITLIVAIAQLPPWLILLPVPVYAFDHSGTTAATIYLVYNIVVSFLDGVLKPLMIGRGMSTPMPVILLGAIGGMITSGIIGLFVGAIILALGYELFMAWLDQAGDNPAADRQEVSADESQA